ncbi:galactoside alpha-(1,2)-fucosyltransferase 2-like isoform X1 [Procambarus clarkii]|uniref:galactoside alpha-(1,2)-fucosyltransferase 2-like isoform X1 n=1 Tax=Procambarus clarkii TaxID=6728 RepID=UPI003743E042
MKILHLYFSVVLIFSYLVMLWTGMLSKSYSRVAAWRGSTPLDRGIPAARRDPRAPAGSANTEVATRGVGLTTPAGEGLAVTAVARWAWEKFPGHLWRGLQLPVMTAWPAGRLGNLMSEYATLYALGKVYGVTVRLHPLMDAALRHIFPHLSMPLIPGNFSDKEWKQLGSLGLSNKADMDAAAAGLMGPHLFVLRGTPHESQLFNAYRRDIQRELTFSDTITTKAQAFLAAVARNTTFPSTPTFVGFHIRRTDYYFMIKQMWGGHVPSERYYRRAMDHFRRNYNYVIFVVASDEPKHVTETLGGDPDVFLAPGHSAEEDLGILAACNHSIMTVGTFGFWGSYLAGGEVLFPNTTYSVLYKVGPKWFRHSKLDFFRPVSDD